MTSQSDQAIGIDMHTIMVPSSSGLQPMPNIPHPFLGKLTDKLSKTVTLGERPIATKGSEAVMPGPGHVPMPPGVQFQKTPKGKGKITGGCVDKVKVDGKPIAVLGSTVSSCSDTGQQDHIKVIAAGAPAVLPIMMPGMDPDQYKRDGGTMFDTRDLYSTKPRDTRYQNPKMKNPKWGHSKAKVGEEVTLSVEFEGQYPGCTAYFDVYKDGDDPEKDPPVKKLLGHNKDGKAEVSWTWYYHPEDYDEPFKEKPKFYFMVSAFKCGKLKSPMVSQGIDYQAIMKDQNGNLLRNVKFTAIMVNAEKKSMTSDETGEIKSTDIVPGSVKIRRDKQKKGSLHD